MTPKHLLTGMTALHRSLHVLVPTEIPHESAVMDATRKLKSGLESAGQMIGMPSSASATHADVTKHLASLLSLLPQADSWIGCVPEHYDYAAHDAYFHVTRVRGDADAAAVFVRMVFAARLRLLEDIGQAGVTMKPGLIEQLDGAFAALGAVVWGREAATEPVVHWEIDARSRRDGWAMTRWIRGHQVFAALSQGLIFSFLAMGRAIKAGDRAATRRWAELSIQVLEGSGAAFVFTGDFPVEEYMEVVRPSMMPPMSEISLSGLMSLDHRFLVQTMRDMRPALRALHEQEPELHRRMQKELATVYDLHIHVCERFVGERPSLLTARHAKKSGPSLIEQFKTLRMKALDAPVHAQRLVERCPVTKDPDAGMQLTTTDSGVGSGTKNLTLCPKES